MSFDPAKINKRVQYITVDSDFVFSSNIMSGGYSMGGNNNFSVNFGTSITMNGNTKSIASSNIFVQEMRNVIGLKLVDFYVTQIGTFEQLAGNTNPLAVKYLDILCPDIPDQAQILDERKSKIFARVPLERDFSGGGSSNVIVNDKQWKSFTRQTNYFNPISIKQLNFQIWELTGQNTVTNPYGSGTYQPLQPDANFYMVLEVTTIDYDTITLPKEDSNMKVVEAIESLGEKITHFLEGSTKSQEVTAVENIMIPSSDDSNKTYIIIALFAVLVLFMVMR